MNPRRIIIVGPSGSGKTTLAQTIGRELGIPVVSMDDFRTRGLARKNGTKPGFWIEHHGQQVRTYEDPRLWDGYAIACKLRALIQAGAGFVAEGNHLLQYPEIAALPDVERYYLDVPFKVSVARRKTRHRFLPADESFALIGESETTRWVVPQLAIPGVFRLDGTESTYGTGSDIIHRRLTPTYHLEPTVCRK